MKMKLLALSLATLSFGSTSFAASLDVGSVAVSALLVQPTCTATLNTNTISFDNVDVDTLNSTSLGGELASRQGVALSLENCPSQVTLKVTNSEGTVGEAFNGGVNHLKSGLMRDSKGSVSHNMQIRVYSQTAASGEGSDGGNIKLNGTPVTYNLDGSNTISHQVLLGKYLKGSNPAVGALKTNLKYTLEYK